MQLGALEYLITVNSKDLAKGLNEAEKKVKSSASGIGEKVKDIDKKLTAWTIAKGKLIADGMKKLASAASGVIRSAVSETANYEQLVGGVDTLFGDASQKVQQYASEAYKSVGISANEYMETVTSFSASLLQSLGGDTAKAADKADMALKDMADNANKMGTAMDSIQHAYQGFAKQNYTMLDNLKLGYGGTKTEMQRLLKDAGKLANKKFDIKSLSDVYDAIHVIQEEMKITGTTADEAERTITGSMNTAKAAWKDLLTAMGTGKDVQNASKRFADSIKKVAKNLVPVVKEVFKNLVVSIKDLIPEFTELVGDIWDELTKDLPKDGFLYKAKEAIEGLLKLLGDLAVDWQGTIDKLKASDSPVLQKLGIALGIVSAVAAWFYKLLVDTPAAIQELKDSDSAILQLFGDALQLVVNLLDWMIKNQDVVVGAVEAMLAAFAISKLVGIFMAMNPIALILTAIAGLATLIITNWEPIEQFFVELWETVSGAVTSAWDTVSKWWGDIVGAVSAAWGAVASWFEQTVWNPIKESFTLAWNVLSMLWRGITSKISNAWGIVSAYFENKIWNPIKSTFDGVWSVISGLWTNIYSQISTAWEGVSKFFTDLWKDITLFLSDIIQLPDFTFIQNWWDTNIKDNLSLSAILNLIPKVLPIENEYDAETNDSMNTGATSYSPSGGMFAGDYNTSEIVIPISNAKGNWNVPYDNYVARLHRDEMVLTKSQARRYREGDDENVDYSVIGSMIGASIEQAMGKVYVMMSGEKVGDLTTRRIKKNLNANSYKKLRALGG